MKHRIISYVCYLLIVLGGMLTIANLYGLNKDIRPPGLFETDLRFKNDISLNYEETIQAIQKDEHEDDLQYEKRLSTVIANGIAHIHWDKEQDTTRFNQLVPIWENYFLYFMGRFSGIPEFEKYHFANYERSLKRGIGICGDASMIMSQLLNEQGIANQIITFPGHVIIAAQDHDGREIMLDPDFGVAIPYSIKEVQQSPNLVGQYYLQKGYTDEDVSFFRKEYAKDSKRWNGVSHFITNKYYFEKITYFLKWPLPILMILSAILILRRLRLTS